MSWWSGSLSLEYVSPECTRGKHKDCKWPFTCKCFCHYDRTPYANESSLPCDSQQRTLLSGAPKAFLLLEQGRVLTLRP